MTDRLNGLHVVLTEDIRTDDAEALISAIKQLRGVLDVKTSVADPRDWMAQRRARQELGTKLWEVLYPPSND